MGTICCKIRSDDYSDSAKSPKKKENPDLDNSIDSKMSSNSTDDLSIYKAQ